MISVERAMRFLISPRKSRKIRVNKIIERNILGRIITIERDIRANRIIEKSDMKAYKIIERKILERMR